MRWPISIIVAFALGAWLGLPGLFRLFLAAPDFQRVVISIITLAPLAFFLGMPFALGLARAPKEMLPWAWSVNGCFSVIGAVLASVLAMDFGFGLVIVSSAVLYLAAGLIWHRL